MMVKVSRGRASDPNGAMKPISAEKPIASLAACMFAPPAAMSA